MSDLRALMRREVERARFDANGYEGTLRRVHRRERSRRLAAGALALAIFAVSALGIWALSRRTLPASVIPSPQTQRWVSRFDAAHSGDEPQSVAVSRDGARVFVTGYSYGIASAAAMSTVAYDPRNGTKLWAAMSPGPDSVRGPDGPGDELSTAVAVSPDGREVYVTGATGSQGLEDYATVAYDARTGARLWLTRYDGPAHLSDRPRTLAVSPDGRLVFVTGTSEGTAPGETGAPFAAFATVAYDAASGIQAWVERFGDPGSTSAAAGLAVDPSGTRIFVTGITGVTGTQDGDYATVAYQARTGAVMWVRRYDGRARNADGAAGIAVNPNGGVVYVTGQSMDDPQAGYGITTVAYSASTGAERWTSHTDEGGNPRAIGVRPDGSSVFVVGSSDQRGYVTLALDAKTGAQRWVATYRAGLNSSIATDLAVAPDGSKVYVTGASIDSSSTPYDFATVTYRATTGAQLSVARYRGAGRAIWPDALAVSPDGSQVLVTGPSDGFRWASSSDFLTIAYGRT